MRRFVRQAIVIQLLTPALACGAFAQAAPPPVPRHPGTVADSAGTRSNVLPALEITGFLVLLNGLDRVLFPNLTEHGKKVFSTTFSTTWDHLRTQRWEHDPDSFRVNQFGHPYQGSLMYGLARSSGHGFWASLVYANLGSFAWEIAGETVPPSIDDLITTSQAGSLFGEALYRLADLVLKDAGSGRPDRLHEYSAALISPPGGFNRRIFGRRFRARLPDTDPATVWQLKLGVSLDALARDYSSPTTLLRKDASVEFSMSYGLPGQPGYAYTRPLDYFDVRVSALANAGNPIEDLLIRGLLLGRTTETREHASGIWGLYGSYDYISPYLFRVSSTALSLGTTRQYSLPSGLTVQGSVLGGVGYGAAGSRTFIAATATEAEKRDYHRGVTPQALVALKVISGSRAVFDVYAREYYVSGKGSDNAQGSEAIFRGGVGMTVRVVGGQAFGAQYVASTRTARYGAQPNVKLSEGTVTVSYSILGGNGIAAVKWR